MSTMKLDEQYTTISGTPNISAQGDTTAFANTMRQIGEKEGRIKNLQINAAAKLQIETEVKNSDVQFQVWSDGWIKDNTRDNAQNPDVWRDQYNAAANLWREDNKVSLSPIALQAATTQWNVTQGNYNLQLNEQISSQRNKNFQITLDNSLVVYKSNLDRANDASGVLQIYDEHNLKDDEDLLRAHLSADQYTNYKAAIYNPANEKYMFHQVAVFDNGEVDFTKTLENINNEKVVVKTIDGKTVDNNDETRLALLDKLENLAENQTSANVAAQEANNLDGVSEYHQALYDYSNAKTIEESTDAQNRMQAALQKVSPEERISLDEAGKKYLKGNKQVSGNLQANFALLANIGQLDRGVVMDAVNQGKLDPSDVPSLLSTNETSKKRINGYNNKHYNTALVVLANELDMGLDTSKITNDAEANVLLIMAGADSKKGASFMRALDLLDDTIKEARERYGLSADEILRNADGLNTIVKMVKDKDYELDTDEEFEKIVKNNTFNKKTRGIGPETTRGKLIEIEKYLQEDGLYEGLLPSPVGASRREGDETIVDYQSRLDNIQKVRDLLRIARTENFSPAELKTYSKLMNINENFALPGKSIEESVNRLYKFLVKAVKMQEEAKEQESKD